MHTLETTCQTRKLYLLPSSVFIFAPPLLIQTRKPLACRGDELCLKLNQNPYIQLQFLDQQFVP
jgi:hypothetical protein